jgi:hypothetical protein
VVYSGPATLFYNSVPVLQAQSVRLKISTNNKSVHTLHLGRAGHSRGSKEIELTVDNAAPEEGLEVDWELLADAQEEVALGVRFAGTTYECIGDLRDVDMGSSTDDANKVSFTYSAIIVSRA